MHPALSCLACTQRVFIWHANSTLYSGVHTAIWRHARRRAPRALSGMHSAHFISWCALSALVCGMHPACFYLVCTQRTCILCAPSALVSGVHPAHFILSFTLLYGVHPAHVIWQATSALCNLACTLLYGVHMAPLYLACTQHTPHSGVHAALSRAPSVHHLACTQRALLWRALYGVHPARII